MRAVLFHIVMNLGARILRITATLNQILAQGIFGLASFISPEQAEYTQAVAGQTPVLSELSLMQDMVKIQQEAIEEDDWNENMYMRMNQLAQMLHTFHGWRQSDIDNYVARLVESGPEGYSYIPSGDEEEDYE